MKLRNRCAGALLVVLTLVVICSTSAAADMLTVTRTDDPTPDGCAPADCSLREAVIDANGNGLADTITLPAGTYTLAIPGQEEDAAATGDLDITEELTIQGADARTTVIDGGALDRVFELFSSAGSVLIMDLAIRNGFVSGGAGVRNEGATLAIARCALVDNNANGSFGGGLLSTGTALVLESTLKGNTADRGGGVYVEGMMTVVNSTISGNMATSFGGGVSLFGATLDFRNVTVSGNIADSDDDGVGDGGGITIFGSGNVEITHTVVGGNVDLGGEVPDCLSSGTNQLISGGYNLVGNTAQCQIFGDETGNLYDTDPLLSPLANHGGPTDTHALQLGSPAIDAGNPAGCVDENGAPLIVDQRGEVRPFDGDGDLVAVCDMGAFEVGDLIFSDGFESGDTSSWSLGPP